MGTKTYPCAARPSTGFVHLDGPCRCFVGGPPPEFPNRAPSWGDIFSTSGHGVIAA